jgi:hypothetical protein
MTSCPPNERSVAVIIAVHIQTEDNDPDSLDLHAHQLRKELLMLDLDNVMIGRERRESDIAKGDAISIGTLVMALSNSVVLVAACQVIRAWITRGKGRRASISYGKDRTLELTNVTTAQQQTLIDGFLRALQQDPDLSSATSRGDGSESDHRRQIQGDREIDAVRRSQRVQELPRMVDNP